MPLVKFSNLDRAVARSIQIPKCNIEACTDRFAPCFNKGMGTYYCYECAKDINYASLPDGTYLCEIPDRADLGRMEELCYEGKLYVGTQKLEDAKLHPDFYAPNYAAQIAALEPLS